MAPAPWWDIAPCTPAVSASQFALMVAFVNFGIMSVSVLLGWLGSLGGSPAMAVCGLGAAAFAFAAKVGR